MENKERTIFLMSQYTTSVSSMAESIVAIWSWRCNTNSRGRQELITPVWNFRLDSETEGSLFTCIYLWFNQWTQVQEFQFVSEHARSNTCEKGGWEKKRVLWKGKDSQVS